MNTVICQNKWALIYVTRQFTRVASVESRALDFIELKFASLAAHEGVPICVAQNVYNNLIYYDVLDVNRSATIKSI